MVLFDGPSCLLLDPISHCYVAMLCVQVLPWAAWGRLLSLLRQRVRSLVQRVVWALSCLQQLQP